MRRRIWRLLSGLMPLFMFAAAVTVAVTMGRDVVVALGARSFSSVMTVAVPLGLILLCSFVLLCTTYVEKLGRLLEEERETPEGRAAEARERRKASLVSRLLQARDFLPDDPPEGWSRPVAVGGSHRWTVDTDDEVLALVLERERWMMAIKVYIRGRGSEEPVGDARCKEILSHVKHVGEFIERDVDPAFPETRSFVAVPTDQRPRWKVPGGLPALRERRLSPHLVAARKYLPQKLPAGWSVPVAIGDDHGTEWKDGAWMVGTEDEELMIVCLVTSKGRVKLSVSFFRPDATEITEGSAVEMLRHFRGVLEFVQTEAVAPAEGEVPTRTYLGEIAPEGGQRVMLN